MITELCKHCHHYQPNRPRGLCYRCFKDITIRNQYPITSPFNPYKYKARSEATETMEDLEALIASRWATKPAGRGDVR